MADVEKFGGITEPVAAYDHIAPQYARISDLRRPYLDRIEKAIISEVPGGLPSLLDVGAGDGTRSVRIARDCGVGRLVLLEPSAGMRALGVAETETWAMRAEELRGIQDEFSVILCLWNVLGHIAPAATRAEVMRQFARLIVADGLVVIDVNHRYNAAHYGVLPTMLRFVHDLARSSRMLKKQLVVEVSISERVSYS